MPRSAALLLLLPAAWAQSPQATLGGAVRDAQGAAVPQARVSARNLATGATASVETSALGLYSLRQLAVGAYEIAAEHPGFRRYVRTGITLTTGQSLELDIALEVGSIAESVTVSAAASTLETRTSEVSQLVESKAVEDLPLGDRRSMNLIQMTGAAVFVGYDSGQKPNFSLAGGRTQSQMFFIDGGAGQNMRLGAGQIDLDPPVETIQEVKVMSNSVSAEFGGSNGGVIVATTKSGTNRFAGSLFEYLRNDKLDAPNFFAPISGGRKERAPLRYNVFGGVIGGPVRRDKTFFFFAYEGSRRRDGAIRTLTVPTGAQKSGDFSGTLDARGALIPIYDPATTRAEGGRMVRTQYPGNRIPADRFDPVALKLIPFYPLPNRPPDNLTGANNFRANYVNALTRNNYTAKLDHNLGSRDRLTARYLYNSDDMFNTSVFPVRGADTLNDADRHQNYGYGAWIHTFTPALLNDLRFTYSNRINYAKSAGLGGTWPSQVGLKGVPDGAFPQIAAAGFTAFGSNNQERRQFPIQQVQVIDNTSWVRGRHTLKFGGEVRPSFNYEVNRPMASGAFTFSTQPTGQPGVAASGNGLATLLLGFPTSFSARETQALDRYSWYLALFIQDDWTVHKDLTLNIGVRWETDTPITDRANRMNLFDSAALNPVSGTPGVVRFAGVNGAPATPYSTDRNNFGPRFGFAWKPFGATRTVLRGGFGVFFAHPFDAGAPNSASLGFDISAALNTPDNGLTAPFYLRDGVPGLNLSAPALNDSFGAVRVGQQANTAVTFYESDRRTGYSQQFNLGLQRELDAGWMVEAGYIGNLSRKLPSANLSLNQIRPERLGPAATQRDRPFPQFSNVSTLYPTLGVASYHAGLLRVERRFSGGYSLLGTYTWSKNLNNTVEGPGGSLGEEGDVYSDLYNRRADWGPSANDVRHRLTLTSVYELPFGGGRRWLARHPARFLAGGWSIGALATLQSGEPFTVSTQTNSTNAFSAGALRADVLRNPNLPGSERTLARWFDTSAFQQPAPYRFGNQGLNILRADGTINFDFSLLRNFPAGDRRKLQFRGEFFNAFNHPNFGGPGRILGAPGFGVVSSSSPGRRVQLGLRLVF
ncbi:MAG: TonB-dependent receptor [Acidobacteria bacterium]|nr:TonB-dependent receptor [Acidobacteriota bacterium]